MDEFDFDPYSIELGGGLWILLMSLVLLAVALALSRVRSLGLEKDMAIAAIRGLLQVMAIGFVIFAVFQLEDLKMAVTVLAFIAVIPTIVQTWLNIPSSVAFLMGGTSLLIMVGVDLDTMSQIEGQLRMHHHEGIVRKGKIRSRYL